VLGYSFLETYFIGMLSFMEVVRHLVDSEEKKALLP
jgi:hypothetical protein